MFDIIRLESEWFDELLMHTNNSIMVSWNIRASEIQVGNVVLPHGMPEIDSHDGHQHTADELRGLLPGIAFAEAIQVMETISQKTEDLQMYNDREKARRDYQWALAGARQEGRDVGREEGRLAGQVQLLQRLLEEPVATDDDLLARTPAELTALIDSLQTRLRGRSGNGAT